MEMSERVPRSTDEPEANRITVVAIDDHPTYVHGLATLLEDAAPEIEVVAVATAPEDGLDLVSAHDPDVVLLDLQMPRMDGVEVTKRIVDQGLNASVLMLTVSDEPAHVAAAMRAGARGYLSKDVQPEQLISAIRAVVFGEVVLAPFAAEALVSAPDELPRLSDQEICLLRAISDGAGYGEVASQLAISESTLKRQLQEILKKLRVQNKLQAVAYVARRGLL